mgnify:CR=1 FL=1
MIPKEEFIPALTDAFSAWGFFPSPEQNERFYAYACLLSERNRVMNLTAVDHAEGIIERHFRDSLLPLRLGLLSAGKRYADVGTGAGFPGLPLAVMMPEATFVLTDSLAKRITFLNEVIAALGLSNVQTCLSRAETLGHSSQRETFDGVLSRAVSPLPVLCELCLPLCRIGGQMLALKSAAAEEEIHGSLPAATLLGGDTPQLLGTAERNVVVIRKIAPTPSSYPRRDGVPAKKPLH